MNRAKRWIALGNFVANAEYINSWKVKYGMLYKAIADNSESNVEVVTPLKAHKF